MYFREIPKPIKTYYGISAAGNFVASTSIQKNGNWTVFTGSEEKQTAVKTEFKTLHEAFDFMQTIET